MYRSYTYKLEPTQEQINHFKEWFRAIDKENRESQSRFVCKSCGYEANADYNASQNILTRGLRGIVCNQGDNNVFGA